MTKEKIKILVPQLPSAEKILPYLLKIDNSRVYSNYGPLNQEFSARLGKRVNTAYAAITSNGTAAIEVALRIKAIPGRRFCLMPAYTFIASAHAVCNAGLTPFLLDISSEHLMLTPEIVEATLPTLPELPAVVLVVSSFGAPPDQKVWLQFEAKHNIPVVFDAAAAATSLTEVGVQPMCVSLHATKVLGIGEGGAILCSDQKFIDRAIAMTGFGFMGIERVSVIKSGNYRISEYSAAVGLAALDEISERISTLKKLTDYYLQNLKNKSVKLQNNIGEKWITTTFNVIIPPNELEKTLKKFEENNIEWRRWWGLGCHYHPAFFDVPKSNLKITEVIGPCVIGVPFYSSLLESEIERVVACLP